MKKRILVVDDDRRIVELQKVLFRRHGYDVVVASNGNEAIEVALKTVPDLIVLDVEMPGKDGYATLIELRSYSQLKDIPVIILSALTEDVYHQIGRAMGSVDYIEKPFDPERLLSKAREILHRGE